VSTKDPFDQMVDAVVAGRGAHRPAWNQSQRGAATNFDERRFRKALYAYWGRDADSMRVSLALQDASFVAGVVHMVSETLGLAAGDQRRVAAAVLRRRVLGEPDPSLDDVDDAWSAWWPPPPGDEGRMLFAHFLGTWREWLRNSDS
jgi:hypothetical protein